MCEYIQKARAKANKHTSAAYTEISQGQHVPAFEYKPLHKLGVDGVTTGLRAEIQPERDVIVRPLTIN